MAKSAFLGAKFHSHNWIYFKSPTLNTQSIYDLCLVWSWKVTNYYENFASKLKNMLEWSISLSLKFPKFVRSFSCVLWRESKHRFHVDRNHFEFVEFSIVRIFHVEITSADTLSVIHYIVAISPSCQIHRLLYAVLSFSANPTMK